MKKFKFSKYLPVSFAVVILDILTKQAAMRFLENKSLHLAGPLWLTLVKNTGVAFGFLKGYNMLLALGAVIALAVIGSVRKEFYALGACGKLGFFLIAGGAVGNLIDRVIYGFVVDFIDLTYWPVFNIADSAVTIGAVLICYSFVFHKEKCNI